MVTYFWIQLNIIFRYSYPWMSCFCCPTKFFMRGTNFSVATHFLLFRENSERSINTVQATKSIIAWQQLSEPVSELKIGWYNFVKSLGNMGDIPCVFISFYQKFSKSEILRTSKSWKQRFFETEAFGNTRYGDKRQRRKSLFSSFWGRFG